MSAVELLADHDALIALPRDITNPGTASVPKRTSQHENSPIAEDGESPPR